MSAVTGADLDECAKCGRVIIIATSTTTANRIPVAWKASPDGTLSLRAGANGVTATPIAAHHRFGRTNLHLPHQAECRPVQPGAAGAPHAFVRDPDIPSDFHGREFCGTCGCPGEDGDKRHPRGALPAVPRPAPARVVEAVRGGPARDHAFAVAVAARTRARSLYGQGVQPTCLDSRPR